MLKFASAAPLLLLPFCLPASARAQQTSSSTPITAPVNQTVTVVGELEPVVEAQAQRSTASLEAQPERLLVPGPAELLRDDASVDIEQRGGGGVQNDVSIRGSSYEQTLVLVNGLRMDDAETSHFNLDLPVPMDVLAGAYVLNGAGSTLYGSDAVSGVVNFVTAPPPAGSSLRVRAGAGSFGGNEEAARLALAGGHASELLAGARDFSTGFIADRDFRSEEVSSETRGQSHLGDTDVLLAMSDRAFGAAQFYGNYPSWERTKGWFAALTQSFGTRTQAALAYRRHSDVFVLFRTKPSIYENNHIDQSWQGVVRRNDDVHAGMLRVDYGLDVNADEIRSTNLGVHGRNRGAGYVSARLRTGPKGAITAGAREEVFSGGRNVLVPSFAADFYVHSTVKLRGAVSRGFRVPTYNDLYYSDPANRGNPALLPESVWSYEGGADWYANAHWAVRATGFTSRQTNVIDYVRASASDPYQAQNLTHVNLSGVELSAEWRPRDGQQVRAGFTELSGASAALNSLQSKYVFNFPSQNAVLAWTGHFASGITGYGRLRVVHRISGALYPVVDSSLAYERARVHPYLRMTNVTDTSYQEIAGVPMPGRAFTGGVELELGRRH